MHPHHIGPVTASRGRSGPSTGVVVLLWVFAGWPLSWLLLFVSFPLGILFGVAITVGMIVLVWWLLPTSAFEAIFGEDRFDAGGIELFFISGISIVAASTIIIIQNLNVVLGLLRMIGGRFRGALSSVRLGIAYPRANTGRTGMTIAMNVRATSRCEKSM